MIYSRHKTIGLFVASEGCFKAWQNSKTSIDVTSETVMENRRDALMIIILIAAPPLLASLAVGLITSIFQAVTQIQEFNFYTQNTRGCCGFSFGYTANLFILIPILAK